MGDTISRAEVRLRAEKWLNDDKITYSQSDECLSFEHSYRTDCSGFVAMALGITTPPCPSTVDFPEHLERISIDKLEFGDVLGVLGPGTGGNNGHIALFAG